MNQRPLSAFKTTVRRQLVRTGANLTRTDRDETQGVRTGVWRDRSWRGNRVTAPCKLDPERSTAKQVDTSCRAHGKSLAVREFMVSVVLARDGQGGWPKKLPIALGGKKRRLNCAPSPFIEFWKSKTSHSQHEPAHGSKDPWALSIGEVQEWNDEDDALAMQQGFRQDMPLLS